MTVRKIMILLYGAGGVPGRDEYGETYIEYISAGGSDSTDGPMG